MFFITVMEGCFGWFCWYFCGEETKQFKLGFFQNIQIKLFRYKSFVSFINETFCMFVQF